MVSLVIFSITMARLLGRDIYGLISIAVGFIGIFAIFGDVGLNVAGIRYISMYYAKKRYEDIRTIIKLSFLIKLSLGLVLGTICFFAADLFADFFQKNVASLFRITAFVIICNILSSVFQTVMKGMQRMDFFAISNIFRDISWIIVSIGLVLNGWGVIGAMAGYLISALIWLIICGIIYLIPLSQSIPKTQKRKKEGSHVIRNRLIIFGMPVAIMDLTVLLYNWIDTFTLAYFRPTWEVSCYNIAFGLVNMVMIIIASVSTTLFPIFSSYHAIKKKKRQIMIFEKMVKFVIIIIYPLLVLMWFLAPYLILIYGSEYLPAIYPLLILVTWGFFRPISNIGGGFLTSKGRQRLVMKITISMAVLNLILNLILIPILHMIGAAIATSVSFIFGALITYTILLKDYRINLDRTAILKSLLASIIISIIGLGIYLGLDLILISSQNIISLVLLLLKLLISFLVSGMIYLSLMKLLKVFSKDELKTFENLAARYWIVKPVIYLLK
jgi:O-antigen/teichoic acid export membrane protein